MGTIYTIGHSTHPLGEFVGLLHRNRIATLVDIRSFPGSRKFPWFGQEQMTETLAREGIGYVWLGERLGGRRRGKVEGSGNAGWRLESFRSYADYASYNPEFLIGLETLEEAAYGSRVAYMCSEYTHRKCHRGIVSDWLAARGWDVEHVLSNGKLERHEPTSFSVVREGAVWYPSLGQA